MSKVKQPYTISDIRTVSIALSETCNMTCSYCPHSRPDLFHPNKKEFFPQDIYLKIVDYLPNLGNLNYVDLTGFNDFFLTPELATIYLPALKERNLNYIIATNGSINPSNLDYYKSHNPKYLVLGLQTITEQQFNDTSRLKKVSFGSYIEKVAKIIRYFHDNCEDTVVSIEVAYNPTKSLVHKLVGTSYNEAIPSLKDQRGHITQFLEMLSDKTGIEFGEGGDETLRFPDQIVLAHSLDDRVIVGAKSFTDIVNLYNKLPTSEPPKCFMEYVVFHMTGEVSACCIDYNKKTTFGNANNTSMEEIFRQYVEIVNTMRNQGSPFECCRHCFGYNTHREKIAKTIRKMWR